MEIKEIWDSFHVELQNYVRRKVADEQTADDIVQDIFEKVIKNIDRLNSVENLQEYLYKIARNAIVDSYRSRKLMLDEPDQIKADKETELAKVLLDESNSESLNTIISKSCVKPFIEKLPTKYKDALIASEIDNLSQKELAEQLNISYSGAKSRVQRGRKKLKNLLQECCDFDHDSYGNLTKKKSKNCSC